MASNIEDRFPTWGEAGESPPDGFFYEGGDQINEKHLDYLWNNIDKFRDDVDAAISDIKGSSGTAVAEAETITEGGNLLGDLNTVDGETLWDESEKQIPQSRLESTTITLNGGDGLKGGSTAALGGSFSLNIEPSDFAGNGLKDDGADNIAVEASDFIGDGIELDANGNIIISPIDFAGKHLSEDANGNLSVDNDFIENTGNTNTFQSTPTQFVTAANTSGGTGFDEKGIFARVSEIKLEATNETTASIQYADGTSDSITKTTVGEAKTLQKTVDKYAVKAAVNNIDNASNGGSVEIKVRDVAEHSHGI